MRQAVFAALLLLAPASQANAQQPQPTIQQQFEAASTALDGERWEQAVRLFEGLERRLSPDSRRSRAIVNVRKATALFRLDRLSEAETALRLGLADLPSDDASLHEDRFMGLLALAELSELSLDYAEARRLYLTAKELPVEVPLKLSLYRGLIQTEMFEDAPAALAHADEALALAASASTGRQHEGFLRTLRGRTLLNMGRIREARGELRTAMERLGGMTTRVNRADIIARSDLAIAALLDGDEEDARRYLAYTGAGHYETRLSPSSGRMEPPRCDNEIDPEDVVVLEYSIRDDGSIGHVTPIYASRQGTNALAFARAALGWSWDPEAFGEMPPLIRTAMRVELRCSNGARSSRIVRLDQEEVANWSAAKGMDFREVFGLRPLTSPTRLRGDLPRHEGSPTKLLETLILLALHPSVGAAETAGYLQRAIPIAVSEDAPPPLIASLAAFLAVTEHRQRDRAARDDPPSFEAAFATPAIRDNARAAAALRVLRARMMYQRRRDEEAAALVNQVLDSPGLDGSDPILVDARQLQSALAASRADWESARIAFAAIGPGAEPCGIGPRARRPSSSSRDFPRDAARWGFEGWAVAESNLSPDGELTGERTTMSYPPFVFGEAAKRIVARTRFEPVYLPQGGACRPVNSQVTFRLVE